MSIPVQQRHTVATDWKQSYLDLTADERPQVGSSTWNAGWAEGRAFGIRESGFTQEILEEAIFRLMKNARTRALAIDLARSVPLAELDARRYPGVSPQRLAELRSQAAGELRRVRHERIQAAGWAA